MKLAGDLAEFALADLIQVQGLAGRTCAVRVLATEASGALFLVDGRPVHAVYEDLTGEDAFIALLATRSGYFQIDAGTTTPERTLQGELRDLLLDAAARIDDGTAPKPRRARAPRATAPAPAGAAPTVAPIPAGHGRTLFLGGLALLLVLAVAGFAFSRLGAPHGGGAVPGSAVPSQAAASNAVEATALAGSRDALPALLAGAPPAAPAGAALKPTIVCRLLIDAAGHVAEAKIYRSRLDLAAFEEAALDAVERYRFAPGRRDGRPVPVWINWPVTFR
jgi:TonB family protein